MARKLHPRLPYLYRYAPPTPDEEQFRREVRDYVERQHITYLDDDIIYDLFLITSEAVSNKSVQKRQRTSAGRDDLKVLSRLVTMLQKHVDESLRVLAKYRKRKLPVSGILIRPLRREFLQLRRLLARAAFDCRVDAELAKNLQKSSPIDVAQEVNDYLKVDVLELKTQNERNIVIAACVLASGVHSKKEPDDLVSRIP